MARILIVDDNAPVRSTLAALLRSKGHRVEQAADGEQGLASFVKRRHDLVLMDIHVSVANGLEVCQQLRRESQVPILMTSSSLHPYVQSYAFSHGATAFIRKPLNIDHLLAWIGSVLEDRGLTNGSSGRRVGGWALSESLSPVN